MVFDDNSVIILLISSLKPMLWVLTEAILMSTHNIGFYEDLTKIIFGISINTHLISSAGVSVFVTECIYIYQKLLLIIRMSPC